MKDKKTAKSDSSDVASIAVLNGQSLLMGKRRDNGRWTLPGGHLDQGEKKEDGASRELFEESGIEAHSSKLKHLGSNDVTTFTGKKKRIHAFSYEHQGEKPTTKNDPDKEVKKWEWVDVSNGLPKEVAENLHSPKNYVLEQLKLQSPEIKKGGPGSGVDGHVTSRENGDRVVKLTDKITSLNPFRDQLNKMKNGAVWEGKKTASGKPVFNDVNQAIAHAYTPDDFKQVGNMHYDHAEMLKDQMDRLNKLKMEVPKEMKELQDFHTRAFKQNFSAAEKLTNRMKGTENSIKANREKAKEKDVKKSIVGMGYIDASEVDTSKFAVENKISQEHELHNRIHSIMEGYDFGDTPREIGLDKGMLYLSKVDDGMYSGYITLTEFKDNPDAGRLEGMLDNAKVRIERMTVPTLVNFLMAKEYIRPIPEPQPEPILAIPEAAPEQFIALNEALNLPIPTPESHLDKRIRMLELIDKLTS